MRRNAKPSTDNPYAPSARRFRICRVRFRWRWGRLHSENHMAKLTLNPPPTWQKAVDLPVPGGTASVTFTFRRKDLPQLKEFIAKLGEMSDTDAVAAVVTGWNLDDIFDAESVAKLCTTYPGSGFAILREYMRESLGRPFRLERIADLD